MKPHNEQATYLLDAPWRILSDDQIVSATGWVFETEVYLSEMIQRTQAGSGEIDGPDDPLPTAPGESC
jgi:hypothetical protein